MSGRIGKGILVLFFIGLLSVPLVRKHLVAQREGTIVQADEARERYGVYFEEVSEQARIDFTHQAPTFDDRLEHIMPQVASIGASVSVVDVDQDGWSDLYVTNSAEGSANALYRNRGDGTFEDVAPELGLADVNRPGTGISTAAVWGDYDNDGFEDVFLCKWGRVELFHNEGGERFTRVTDQAGLPSWANVNAAVWLDYDRDGFLDLFFGGYYAEDVNLWALEHTQIMPESFEYARNGGRKYLLRGNGDGTFEDVSHVLGPDTRRWMMAVSAADLRGTGYPDLFIANDYGVDEVFYNEAGQGFRAVGEEVGIGAVPKSGMNVAFGDVLNQGQLSAYVTNISQEGILIQGNSLWVPKQDATGQVRYVNLAGSMGVELGGWSYGAQFGDLNNDGALDLFLTNGYISADQQRSYWYDFSKVAGGNKSIISDAKFWPAMEGRSLSGYQQKRVWLNDGAGRFQEVAQAVGVRETYDGRAVAMADLWNRGVLDVIVAHQRGPLLVYRNTTEAQPADARTDWIAFDLKGTASNRSAIGAAVTLFWNGQEQVQVVAGGSGFSAQNQRRVQFGLGPEPQVERAVIRWPSGHVQTLEAPAPGQRHTVQEPEVSS